MPHKNKTEKFIKDAINTHGEDKFDYSRVIYRNASTKVQIICKKCSHVFEQQPRNHKRGDGCPSCGGSKKLSLAEFIEKAVSIHGDKYDYSKSKYNNFRSKVEIRCKTCSKTFLQSPASHLRGEGCPTCGGTKKLILDEFIKGAIAVHGNKYDYSKVKYLGTKRKVKIICKEHGIFEQTPFHHKRGNGCPQCVGHGFDVNKPGILYYVRVNKDGMEAYKIGITNRSVKKRFDTDMKYITVIEELYFENGEEALAAEEKILEEFNYLRWTGL